MQAYVYKSLRKADTYVYLSARDDFQRLPDLMREQLGSLQFVLEVELTPQRKLARADAEQVRRNLRAHGFHLQFPPALLPSALLPSALLPSAMSPPFFAEAPTPDA
ncbi:YcgL domain-containing protein [Lysobacter sp. CA199]|uniref:YcgL domain-containing protein n=1 Tax=Lysobacter sp. CA199 TaxID=3455608 RepID=UPI003F8D5A44